MIEVALPLTWAAMFTAPALGAFLVVSWRASSHARLRRKLIAAGLLVGVVGLSWTAGLQTSSVAVNFVFCLAAFHSYWVLAAATWMVKPRAAGMVLGIAAWLPIVPTLLLGTVGVLALAFILGDYLSPPREARRLTPGLSCRVTLWGAAMTDEGYTVHLYRSLPWFPLVRLEAATVVVNETSPGTGAASATCESVAADMAAKERWWTHLGSNKGSADKS